MSSEEVYARRYLILAIILAGTLMSVLDGIVVNIALPTITSHYGVALAQSQWIITAYLLTMTGLLLVFGRVSRYTGRARLFILGFTLFSLSSLACGLAPNLAALIVFRVAQAVGGAMVFSISSAVIFQAFPPQERGRAMGYLGSTVAIGGIAGPALGGFIVQLLGWRYIFFINLPIGVLVVGAALKFLRLPENREPRLAMDWPGAAALAGFLTGLLLFLGALADQAGRGQLAATGALILVSLTGLVLCERRSPEPLLELESLRNLRFLLPLIVMAGYFVAAFMLGVIGPFFLEGVMRYQPAMVGLVYMVTPIVTAFGSPLSGLLYDRWHSPYFTPLGLGVLGLSYLFFGWVANSPSLPYLIIIFALNGLGSALFQSPNNTELMNAVPQASLAFASSISATTRNLGMALGTSLAGLMAALGLRTAGQGGDLLHTDPAVLAAVSARVLWSAGALALFMSLVALAGAGTKARSRAPEAG
ncbi:MAG: MFS transporter [Bacteroidota bacterium]